MVERSLCMREVQGSIPCISSLFVGSVLNLAGALLNCTCAYVQFTGLKTAFHTIQRGIGPCAQLVSVTSTNVKQTVSLYNAGRLLNALRQHSAHKLRTSMDSLKLITAWDTRMLQVSAISTKSAIVQQSFRTAVLCQTG